MESSRAAWLSMQSPSSQSASCYSYDRHRYSVSRSSDRVGGGTLCADVPASSSASNFDHITSEAAQSSRPYVNGWQSASHDESKQLPFDKYGSTPSDQIRLPSRHDSFSLGWTSRSIGVTGTGSDDFPMVSSVTDICAIADSSGLAQTPPKDSDSMANEMLLSIERRLFQFESDGEEDFSDEDDVGREAAALGDSSACNVCGDVVAGFHCGAYVCEACKKFFVRCLKQDAGSKFTCSQNNDCVITKETRTQCPRCRYQKCLTLGMYRPGGPNLSSEICHIPCKVCGAPSSGFHFGAITCEGCKGFFRRSVKERDCLKYQCTRDGNCTITWKTRNVCKMCRYNQCLRAGMKPDKSRIGRQPNAIKHATFLKLCRIKSVKGLMSPTDPFPKFEMCGDSIDPAALMSSTNDGIDLGITSSHRDKTVTPGGLVRKKRAYTRRVSKISSSVTRPSNRGNPALSMDMLSCTEIDSSQLGPDGNGVWHIKQETESPPPELPYDDEDLILAECSGAGAFDYSMIPPDGFRRMERWSRKSEAAFRRLEMTPDRYDCRGNGEQYCQGRQTPTDALLITDNAPKKTGTEAAGRMKSTSSSADLLSSLPSFEETIATMRRAYFDLIPILSKPPNMPRVTSASTFEEVWAAQMFQFTHDAQATLKFAKKVPGFRGFAMEEQIQMVQMCMFPMVMVMLSLTYDVTNRQFNWFAFTEYERQIIFDNFKPFHCLEEPFHSLGQVIQELEPDETEVAFLCGLHLIDSGTQHVYKELLVDALGEYTAKKDLVGSNSSCRQAHILMCLRDMADANECHKRSVEQLFADPKCANVHVPQLFKETFFGMDENPENPNDSAEKPSDDNDDVDAAV